MNGYPLHNLVREFDIQPDSKNTVQINISKSYSGADIRLPVTIWRGPDPGPTVAVIAAIHGDEINGTGVIRQILLDQPFKLDAGSLIMVPVVNMLGFERQSRYMPDRRDLNRCFPGSRSGSLASRMARSFFDQVIRESNYAIDLHTAAVRRTNFPNVRADMGNEKLKNFAKAFGAELIVNGKGPKGSLRNAACNAGCATLILEAGEVWKVEPSVVSYATRGIRNCLQYLNMTDEDYVAPAFQIIAESTKWLRAKEGGFLQFHVRPGDFVNKGDLIATNTSLTGNQQSVVRATRPSIILGMTTLPAVVPGSPVCHLAYPKKGVLKKAEQVVQQMDTDSLLERAKGELGSSLLIKEEPSTN